MEKEEIVNEMIEVMPFRLGEHIFPYIYEAMDLYANQQSEAKDKEIEELNEICVAQGVFIDEQVNEITQLKEQ